MRLRYVITALLLTISVLLSPLTAQTPTLYNWNTKANWDDFYDIGAEGAWGHPNTRAEIRLNYHRAVILPFERFRANNLKTALGWTSATKIHFINCGFGWVLEALQELGITATCSTTSTYIQNAKFTNEDSDLATKVQGVGLTTSTGDGLTLFSNLRNGGNARAIRAVDVLNLDVSTQTARQAIRTAIGGPGFDLVDYDGYLNSFIDADAIAFAANLRRISGVGRVIHVVYNWLNTKTLAQWKALLPNDIFVDGVTFQVL